MKPPALTSARLLGLATVLALHVSLSAQSPAAPAAPSLAAPANAPQVAPGNRAATVKTARTGLWGLG